MGGYRGYSPYSQEYPTILAHFYVYMCIYFICICIMPYFVVFSLIEAQNSKKTASQIGSYFVVFSLIAVKNN
jgi:hypothetical protein